MIMHIILPHIKYTKSIIYIILKVRPQYLPLVVQSESIKYVKSSPHSCIHVYYPK